MDQHQQKPTTTLDFSVVGAAPIPFEELSPQQQYWVDYNVVQGVITQSDGEMTKVTVQTVADRLNVNRSTLYDWSKNIPNFWELVAERRKVIFSGARLAKVWNAVFLAATVKLNVQAQQIYLANADENFKMPSQTMQHEAGESWAALMANRVKPPEPKKEPIEGEVVPDVKSEIIE